jgi:hypothetical protein
VESVRVKARWSSLDLKERLDPRHFCLAQSVYNILHMAMYDRHSSNLTQGGTCVAWATLSTTERSAEPAIKQTRLFINNDWVDPLDGTCFDT